MNGNFKLSDIKAGYLLEVSGHGKHQYMTVAPGQGGDVVGAFKSGITHIEAGALGCCCPGVDWWPLAQFTDADNLREKNGIAQIEAVYGYAPNQFLLDNSTEHRELLWSRVEPAKVKKPRFLSKSLQKFRKNAI